MIGTKLQPDMLTVRPYQLMCLVCVSGAEWPDEERTPALRRLADRLRAQPQQPVRLVCNADSAYSHQNPGTAEDTPEGGLFNEKRDLDILQRLGLVPGSVRPGLELLQELLEQIPTAQGICGYVETTAPHWRGCPLACSGRYERGIQAGVEALLPGRTAAEKALVKRESVAAMYRAGGLRLRPHHLMCMACFHGGREELEPIDEDNLFEAIDIIQRCPAIPVTLVRGCCVICPPCSHYEPERNQCQGGHGMHLRDQKKDLDVLQRLGLAYGDTLPACDLYGLLFERVPSTRLICAYGDGVARSREWSICREPEGSDAYARAREAGLGIPRASPDKRDYHDHRRNPSVRGDGL